MHVNVLFEIAVDSTYDVFCITDKYKIANKYTDQELPLNN